MEFERPRGTRDFLFDEMRRRKEVENTLRRVFENYGFGEVQTPLFEDLKLFTTKSGDEVVNQLYNFTDKGGRELTLRPEITAPIARLYLNEMQKTAKPIKLYYYGSCFRYERPQKGRFRQFWQFGCELIGAKSPEAEAEAIAMCSNAIEELGITTAEFNVNHLGIIRGLFKHFDIDEETQTKIMVVIDKGDKELLKESLIGEDPVIKDNPELNNVLFKLMDMVGDSSIIADIRDLVSPYEEAQEALEEFEELVETLEAFKVFNYKLNLGVARGLDYYTGIVFEVYVEGLGAQKQICGGGTYSLIKLFGGEEVVSTGFALGFDRLINAIEELTEAKELEPTVKAYVAAISPETRKKAFEIAQNLRLADIPTEVDLSRKKFKKLLNYANKIGVKYTILVGERDLEEGNVTVKNMESGDQELIAIDEVAEYIKNN
ncbi:MAG: histidine--tRNA ligase [Methanobacteriaceae archaeon]|nr:histidine--tRNA ligase [Methanobacteriaceae archaeon]